MRKPEKYTPSQGRPLVFVGKAKVLVRDTWPAGCYTAFHIIGLSGKHLCNMPLKHKFHVEEKELSLVYSSDGWPQFFLVNGYHGLCSQCDKIHRRNVLTALQPDVVTAAR